jgi:hypothetical protein
MIRYPIASGDVVIAPRCSVKVEAHIPLGEKFQPTWISMPDRVARSVVVTDFKVGQNSQLVSCGCLPGALFSDSAVEAEVSRSRLMLEAFYPGQKIVLSVQSLTDDPLGFSADVIGYSVADPVVRSLKKLYALGLGLTPVREGGGMNIHVQPQVSFRGERLYVPDEVIDAFELEVVRKGVVGESRYWECALGKASAERSGCGAWVMLDPGGMLDLSGYVTVVARNRLGRQSTFSGAILGSPVGASAGQELDGLQDDGAGEAPAGQHPGEVLHHQV